MSIPQFPRPFGPPPIVHPGDVNVPQGATEEEQEARALALDIAKLLRTPEVQAVNFAWGHMKIRPNGWNKVATALTDGRISVEIGRRGVKEFGGRVLGVYLGGGNSIRVKSHRILNTSKGREIVVHECAHAVLDARRQLVRANSEHAMVYLAEAWWRLNVMGIRPGGAVPFLKKGMPKGFYRMAQALRERAASSAGTIEMTADERKEALHRIRHREPDDGFYDKDGF